MKSIQRDIADLDVLNGLIINSKNILEKLSVSPLFDEFVLAGGSAIALYLNHRLSENYNFYSFGKNFEWNDIYSELKLVYPQTKIVQRAKGLLGFNIIGTLITFADEEWDITENANQSYKHLKIANIEVLTAMKIKTLFFRAKYEDYYDLYVINNEVYTIDEMFDIAKKYIKGINMRIFQQALMFADDIEDGNIEFFNPRYILDKREISNYFISEIKKWNLRLSRAIATL